MKQKKLNRVLIFRMREEAEGGLTTTWLIEKDGPALSGKLHGVMPTSTAEWIAAQLEKAGVVIQREKCPYKCADEPRPKTVMKEQQKRFAKEKDVR